MPRQMVLPFMIFYLAKCRTVYQCILTTNQLLINKNEYLILLHRCTAADQLIILPNLIWIVPTIKGRSSTKDGAPYCRNTLPFVYGNHEQYVYQILGQLFEQQFDNLSTLLMDPMGFFSPKFTMNWAILAVSSESFRLERIRLSENDATVQSFSDTHSPCSNIPNLFQTLHD